MEDTPGPPRGRGRARTCAGSPARPITSSAHLGLSDYILRLQKRRYQDAYHLDRAKVISLFDKNDWISTPIVVCSFALFFEPNPAAPLKKFIPSEIGLSAFSLKDGIIDNFASHLDLGDDIPKGRGLEALSAAKIRGLPSLGSCEKLKKYKTLAATIESFMAKNTQKLQNEYFVYALSCDMEKVNGCLEWISDVSDCDIPVRVLNLSLWSHFATTQNDKRYRREVYSYHVEVSNSRLLKPSMTDALQSLIDAGVLAKETARIRDVGRSSTSTFINPDDYKPLSFGIFVTEDDVDNILRTIADYKYCDEFCCTYHMKNTDGIEKCALNISNQYAFSLLAFLANSNLSGSIRRPFHFPTTEQLPEERKRRINMLKSWGSTELEMTIGDASWEEDQLLYEETTTDSSETDRVSFEEQPSGCGANAGAARR